MRFVSTSGGITENVGRPEGFTESGNSPLNPRTTSAWRVTSQAPVAGLQWIGSDSLNRSSSVRSDSPNAATLDRSTSGATDVVFIQPLGKPDGQTHPPRRPCRRLWVAGHPILQQAYDKYAYDATPPRDVSSVSAFSGLATFSGLARW